MFHTMSNKTIALIIFCAILMTGHSWAEKNEIQKKLSQNIHINLNDVTISEALSTISKKAGISFVLSDEAKWKLPQAGATRISVVLEGSLADSMTEMLNEFFMRYAVGDEQVTIYPRPELSHIIGRPTPKQLDLLKKIFTTKMTFAKGVPATEFIGDWLKDKAVIVPSDVYMFFNATIAKLTGELSEGKHSPEITFAQMLNEAGRAWYITPPVFPGQVCEIRVGTLGQFNEAKLGQIVDISFENEQAGKAIEMLAGWTGMDLYIDSDEPDWLEQEISVNVQNIKLGQALTNIVTSVGGNLVVRLQDNHMIIKGPKKEWMQKESSAPRRTRTVRTTRSTISENYVGKISVPMDGGRYYIEFMLRESDLTEELKKLRKEKINEILGVTEEEKEEPTKEK